MKDPGSIMRLPIEVASVLPRRILSWIALYTYTLSWCWLFLIKFNLYDSTVEYPSTTNCWNNLCEFNKTVLLQYLFWIMYAKYSLILNLYVFSHKLLVTNPSRIYPHVNHLHRMERTTDTVEGDIADATHLCAQAF